MRSRHRIQETHVAHFVTGTKCCGRSTTIFTTITCSGVGRFSEIAIAEKKHPLWLRLRRAGPKAFRHSAQRALRERCWRRSRKEASFTGEVLVARKERGERA